MDPGIDNEWLTCKNDPGEETQLTGNAVRAWQWRELGLDPPHYPANKNVLENVAEDILVQKSLKIRCCDLPGYPRSTFLMVFSPDGTKVASTHGNHNVYVSELASGKHVRILKGHPRTPWCIAFHPSHTQLIGSGCLGGQVRVWDISSGGSEIWNVPSETVIASIAFHPREQLLVIATYNELYFWDWSRPAPYMRVTTKNVNEKVRYVAFDALGYKLITGISLWAHSGPSGGASVLQPDSNSPPGQNSNRRDDDDTLANRNPDSGSAQDMIVNSYQNLVQRYDSLVRNYQRLFMVRHRLTNTSPPPTIDRGTDPMETDVSPGSLGWTRNHAPANDGDPGPSTSRQQDGDSGDGEASSSRLLNLDVLSIDGNPERNSESPQEHSIFGSRSSAFQPLAEGRTFRTVDQSERSTRFLPNPFSSTGGSMRNNRPSFSGNSDATPDTSANTSRTSIFTSYRPGSTLGRAFLEHRRNSSPSGAQNITRSPNTSLVDNSSSTRAPSTEASTQSTTPGSSSQRPTMTNSATQMSPTASASVDAQTINESLDLIRDILRDSGTRLLNLITNMSLSTLSRLERSMPRRAGGAGGAGGRTQSDDSESGGRSRGSRGTRPRMRLISSLQSPRSFRYDFLSSSSDSDSSDHSLEVNIFRTRNAAFPNDLARGDRQTETAAPPVQINPNGRMTFELEEPMAPENVPETGGIHITVEPTNSRFHVRTQNDLGSEEAGPSTRHNDNENEPEQEIGVEPEPEIQVDPTPNAPASPRPSTSRDNFWEGGSNVTSEEAFRKVKAGVNALQKHTTTLTNLWLRGNRTTMRELRTMWENLRRRIMTLHRETGRQDLPSHYTRSLLERCMMLTDMGDNLTRPTMRASRNRSETGETGTRNTESRDASTSVDPTITTNEDERDANSPTTNPTDSRPSTSGRSPQTRAQRTATWRRILSSSQWRGTSDAEVRGRRPRNLSQNRNPRLSRSRRDFVRVIEISATRHEIRMRAMQVLSVMFNMMMMCLEERGLSQLIITMLRTLKKALALTCLMLMMNRNSARAGNGPGSPSQRVDPLNVVRIQNDEHSGPVNVDGPDEPVSAANATPADEAETSQPAKKKAKNEQPVKTSTSQSTSTETDLLETPPSTSASAPQKWSNRLAVQIAAANRNTSATARSRRDLYLESRRLKALHRTNPIAHPITKKRALPPVSTHRIPALRSLPSRLRIGRLSTPRNTSSEEPVAGPSNAPNASGDQLPNDGVFNEFEHRVNLIRLAHLQAVRLRNAARTRFRRLQTIRLYTPSSVHEMSFGASGSRSPMQNGQESGNRRPFSNFAMYHRPHILTPRGESGGRPNEEPGHFHTVLNNVAMPLMQVNELPPNAEGNGIQPNRLPRIHEYLQPIILAQNAMVVDDDNNEAGGANGGGGVRRISAGMAGLLDAGIISETIPAPSHRVQAWDFTTGETPDIGNSTKNVVVQRCRIHNDASIDISKDGRLLVALLPVPRLRNTNHWLGVYSLEWARLGQCLHTAVLEQSAVSVALSPTARHLAVGLGSRRFTTTPHARNNVFALLYRLEPLESSSRTGLSPIKELEQNWEHGFTSLNCLRWAPQPGQGLVYANNTGQLIIMS